MSSQENPDIKLKCIIKIFPGRLSLKMLSYAKYTFLGVQNKDDFDTVFLLMEMR